MYKLCICMLPDNNVRCTIGSGTVTALQLVEWHGGLDRLTHLDTSDPRCWVSLAAGGRPQEESVLNRVKKGIVAIS